MSDQNKIKNRFIVYHKTDKFIKYKYTDGPTILKNKSHIDYLNDIVVPNYHKILKRFICNDVINIIKSYLPTFYKSRSVLEYKLIKMSKTEPVIYNRIYGCVFILDYESLEWVCFSTKRGKNIRYSYKNFEVPNYYTGCNHNKHLVSKYYYQTW